VQLRTIKDFLVDISLTPTALAARIAPVKRGTSKIGYIGWVGHANLGDEAMFQAISKSLAPNQVLPLLPVPGERLLEAVGAGGAKRFGAVVLGGGTLINRFYIDLAKLVASWKVPFCVAGTGVGSPGFGFSSGDEGNLQGWAEILRRSPLVGVRGPKSAQLLQGTGVSNVEIIGDPALAFTPDSLPPLRAKPRLVLNLGPDCHSQNAGVASVAREFLRGSGEVVGVALGAGDRACLLRFRRQHGFREMSVESHRDAAERLFRTLAGSQAVISVRLHAAVLAACAGVPSVLLAYRSKCLDFMSSMNLQEFAVATSVAEDAPYLRELLRKISCTPKLREMIHQTALMWAGRQQEFFGRLRQMVASTSV